MVSDSKIAHVRIIGDVHGRIRPRTRSADRDKERRFMPLVWRDTRLRSRSYLGLTSECNYSVQVGDLSHDYTDMNLLTAEKHKVIAGNHDNLPKLTSHFLGDFGTHSFPLESDEFAFFFVRGAASVDRPMRVEGLNWWREEELAPDLIEKAMETYRSLQPRIVITHDCPTEILPLVGTLSEDIPASRTNQLLQQMLESHAPQWWFFGHHHHSYVFQHPAGTRFVCLGTMAYFDFDATGKSIFTHPR